MPQEQSTSIHIWALLNHCYFQREDKARQHIQDYGLPTLELPRVAGWGPASIAGQKIMSAKHYIAAESNVECLYVYETRDFTPRIQVPLSDAIVAAAARSVLRDKFRKGYLSLTTDEWHFLFLMWGKFWHHLTADVLSSLKWMDRYCLDIAEAACVALLPPPTSPAYTSSKINV